MWGSVLVGAYIGGWTYQSGRAGNHLTAEARALVGAGARASKPLAQPLAQPLATAGHISGKGFRSSAAGGGPGLGAGPGAATGTAAPGVRPCVTPTARINQVAGMLEVPSLGMQAPVVQGESEGVLAEAVGHDVSSVWPGEDGTAVLAAHDVSYFARISTLRRGDRIHYLDGCHDDVFVVTGSKVVPSGTTVVDLPTPYLVLDTCWPTDALWYTPSRYLVFAREVAVQDAPSAAAVQAGGLVRSEKPLVVPVPAQLAAQGLTLDDNATPLGTMTVAGRPSAAFVESPMPLDVEESALTAYFGALHALAQGQTRWWSSLAPGVAIPAAGDGAYISEHYTDLLVTILARGDHAAGAVLTSTDAFSGGSTPGTYTLRAKMVVRGNELVIGSWSMTPYRG